MSLRVVKTSELLAHEFSKVEGGIRQLDARDLEKLIPLGMSLERFNSQLYDGHIVLLNDSPIVPAFRALKGSSGEVSWSLSPTVSHCFSPLAQNALSARTKIRGGIAEGGQSKQLSPPEPEYKPEPIVDERPESPSFDYEFRFEVACSEEALAHEVGCQFALGRAPNEPLIGSFEKRPSEYGTEFIAKATTDAPRRLITKVASSEMGLTHREKITIKPVGQAVAIDSFIPVRPAIRLDKGYGFPTEGYYYHFHNYQLVQEYCLLGNRRWAFYATRSTHETLNTEEGFNQYQGAILVFWKINGAIANNQHLVYLKSPIRREELDNINEDWLSTYGFKLNIQKLLSLIK